MAALSPWNPYDRFLAIRYHTAPFVWLTVLRAAGCAIRARSRHCPICASSTLPLGRYYPVIIETDREWCEWDAFLHARRVAPIAPDLFDRRASGLVAPAITFAHYDPPESGWPWILLCRWPTEHVAVAGDGDDLFARSAYTIEVTADSPARTRMQERLLASLDRHGTVEIVIVPPSRLAGSS